MALPTFLIIGANKAGTTSLHHLCSQHPDVFMAPVKEPMFFSTRRAWPAPDDPALRVIFTLEEYEALFEAGRARPLRGEASTSYLANPECAMWIRKVVPDIKLVAVLRDPLERAVSNHGMYAAQGRETRSFEQAVFDEIEHGTKGVVQGQQYLHLGLYGAQIEAFRRYFSPDQLFIGDYARLDADTPSFISDVFAYLGARPFEPPDLSRKNTGRPRVPVSTAAAQAMRAFFEADVQRLQPLVDFDVLRWLDVGRQC